MERSVRGAFHSLHIVREILLEDSMDNVKSWQRKLGPILTKSGLRKLRHVGTPCQQFRGAIVSFQIFLCAVGCLS